MMTNRERMARVSEICETVQPLLVELEGHVGRVVEAVQRLPSADAIGQAGALREIIELLALWARVMGNGGEK